MKIGDIVLKFPTGFDSGTLLLILEETEKKVFAVLLGYSGLSGEYHIFEPHELIRFKTYPKSEFNKVKYVKLKAYPELKHNIIKGVLTK